MSHHTRTNLGGVVVNSSNSNILDALWEITSLLGTDRLLRPGGGSEKCGV